MEATRHEIAFFVQMRFKTCSHDDPEAEFLSATKIKTLMEKFNFSVNIYAIGRIMKLFGYPQSVKKKGPDAGRGYYVKPRIDALEPLVRQGVDQVLSRYEKRGKKVMVENWDENIAEPLTFEDGIYETEWEAFQVIRKNWAYYKQFCSPKMIKAVQHDTIGFHLSVQMRRSILHICGFAQRWAKVSEPLTSPANEH